MAKFRKKPVVISAVQFHANDMNIPTGVVYRCGDCVISGHAHIHTLEGPHIVSDGDWIITGVAGEKYPCKPSIFEATYEPVSEIEEMIECAGGKIDKGSLAALPDGSGCFTASYPLPKDHWLYRERTDEEIDHPPQATIEQLKDPSKLRDAIREAAKWAIKASTQDGKIQDFDPDAMVQNIVYAICGPSSQVSAFTPEKATPAVVESLVLEALQQFGPQPLPDLIKMLDGLAFPSMHPTLWRRVDKAVTRLRKAGKIYPENGRWFLKED